jgi:phage-related protein
MKKLEAKFFRTLGGIEPVREFLKELDQPDRKTVGEDIATVEYGWPVGMPTCKSLGNGLWEVRSNISNKRILRVVFCVANRSILLLHAFIKKTPKTPLADMNLALSRKKELEK